MSTLLTIRHYIPSRGLQAGLCRLLRRTGNSWNTPAPQAIEIWKGATYSRERATAPDETDRRSQRHHHPDGELKSKLASDSKKSNKQYCRGGASSSVHRTALSKDSRRHSV